MAPADRPALTPEAIEYASKLFDNARRGETAVLVQAIEKGIPVNMLTRDGNSFIMLAAYHGNADTVRALLQLNADPNILNDRQQSPIAGAVFKGYSDVVQILVQSGKADIRLGTPNAIETAQTFKRDDMLKLLGQ